MRGLPVYRWIPMQCKLRNPAFRHARTLLGKHHPPILPTTDGKDYRGIGKYRNFAKAARNRA